MIYSSKIVAIDNDINDLSGLMSGFNKLRVPCLPIHFTPSLEDLEPLEHVRLIFSDLHLLGTDQHQLDRHFGILSNLINELVNEENGPYVLILWTSFPDQAALFENYLYERNFPEGHRKPVSVIPLSKEKYLTTKRVFRKGGEDKLVRDLDKTMRKNAQVAALINWEVRAMHAAGKVTAAMGEFLKEHDNGDGQVPDQDQVVAGHFGEKLKTLLGQFAYAAVGEDRVAANKLAAMNAALSPLLHDSIFHLPQTREDKKLWDSSYDATDTRPPTDTVAKLNRMIHISTNTEGLRHADRGVVFGLDWGARQFRDEFGCSRLDVKKYYRLRPPYQTEHRSQAVLIQAQPPCDYANKDQNYLPYILGVIVEADGLHGGTLPAAIWQSPKFDYEERVVVLLASADFQTRLNARTLSNHPVQFRLRDDLLTDLSFKMSTHLSRPGVYSFRD